MNYVVEEMLGIINDDEFLAHYGMPRRSGRYPWGSGEDPYQRSNKDFLARVEELKKSGWTETAENVKEEFGITTTQYRREYDLCKQERRIQDIETIKKLKAKNLSNSEIGRRMGKRESTIRSLLDEEAERRTRQAFTTADFIESKIKEKGMLDVGGEVHRELGISKDKLGQALLLLEDKGYPIYGGGIPNVTNPGKQTNQLVICPKGTPHSAIFNHANVHSLSDYTSRDGGKTYDTFRYPSSMDSKRLKIRSLEEGGAERDGLIEIRRGVKDLSLGDARYSQVRILVDNTHYLKGMAVYSDNLPDGVDIVFNSNKSKDLPKLDHLKKIKENADNPFGALIKPDGQSTYIDKDGKEKLSLINKKSDEGDWSDWQDALPSQFLAKQPMHLIKKQLKLSIADKEAEYETIMSLTNNTIKKHYLQEFADNCDSAAVHLKAAALPGQKYQVIIPINTLKDNEVYAPNFPEGSKIALVRYPHAGTFEIPVLTVTHKNKDGDNFIGRNSRDAVGINHKIAGQLSGADFDGDTVMAIPTHDPQGKVKINYRPPLKGLEGFDPKDAYPEREGMRYMSKSNTQKQMGEISNLITDMTLHGAKEEDLVKAVKHSMCVIDANKHNLDYVRSEKENDIASLKAKYQKKINDRGELTYGGASTILSRSKGEVRVAKRQGTATTNIKGKPNYDPTKPEGALIYKTADPKKLYYVERNTNNKTGMVTVTTAEGKKITYDGRDAGERDKYAPIRREDPDTGEVSYTNKSGTITYMMTSRTEVSTRMAEAQDARELVSLAQYPKELAYADYANKLKSMANTARKELMTTPNLKQDDAAKKKYKAEISSLNSKLNDAELNRPRERAAMRIANASIEAKKKENPALTKEEIKKLRQQEIKKARDSVGAVARRDRNIDITDIEWEAIQAGAISHDKLNRILKNTDPDKLRERATPKATTTLSAAKINTIKAMDASNYAIGDIAKKLGVSTSVVYKYLKGAK